MITSDFHTHTNFSSDSKASIDDMITKAISLGLTHLCITDHFDYRYPKEIGTDLEFIFNTNDYFDVLKEKKEYYKDKITLLIGIELGLRNESSIKEDVRTFYDHLLFNAPLDFVIGSTHVLEQKDPYYDSYWENKDTKIGITDYFASISHNATYYNNFDVYGHLDYIIRYVKDGVKEYRYEDYREIIDEALHAIISTGKGIELNTSGFKYGLGVPHPKKEILARYKALGGTLLTIGSDAHTPEHIAYDFQKAKLLLEDLGFTHYTIYKNRIPEQVKL